MLNRLNKYKIKPLTKISNSTLHHFPINNRQGISNIGNIIKTYFTSTFWSCLNLFEICIWFTSVRTVNMKEKKISGFSNLSKRGKISWVVKNFFKDPEMVTRELMSFWLQDEEQQRILDGFSENTISNYYLPYGVAPNFIINGKTYVVPMVIEESSVVAAASKSAGFWFNRGGFMAGVENMVKSGHVYFRSNISLSA